MTFRKKLTLRLQTEQTIRSLIITLAIMILVLAFAFLTFTSRSAQLGYSLEQQKILNEELKRENAALKAKLTDVSSFKNLEETGEIKQMSTPEEKTYVSEEDNRVN